MPAAPRAGGDALRQGQQRAVAPRPRHQRQADRRATHARAGEVTSGRPHSPAIAVTPIVLSRTAFCSAWLARSSGAGPGEVG